MTDLKPVWIESFPGHAFYGYDTGRRRFFQTFSKVFFYDLDDKWNCCWVHTSSLIDRT